MCVFATCARGDCISGGVPLGSGCVRESYFCRPACTGSLARSVPAAGARKRRGRTGRSTQFQRCVESGFDGAELQREGRFHALLLSSAGRKTIANAATASRGSADSEPQERFDGISGHGWRDFCRKFHCDAHYKSCGARTQKLHKVIGSLQQQLDVADVHEFTFSWADDPAGLSSR